MRVEHMDQPPSKACRAAIGTHWKTAASSATCARAIASCTRASAAYASCARAKTTQMVLTTYGRSSGFCIDPIEKKPLNHFLPGTPVLSFGTAGCNLTCKFCQNWDISKARELDRIQDLASPEAIAEAAVRSGCRSVAFTYNDPVIFLEYAVDVAAGLPRAGHQDGGGERGLYLAGAAARNSSGTWTRPTSTSRDSPRVSTRISARASSLPVLETLEYLKHETDVWFEITTLLIPGENDSPAEIEAESRWVMERSRSRRAAAFHRLPSGLEDAGHAADARRRRFARPAASRSKQAFATSTPAISTIPQARAPIVTAAVRC